MIEVCWPPRERLENGWLPTEDDLPYDDGKPMESDRHVLEMILLRETLARHWHLRDDFCIGTNMFLYYNLEQVRRRRFLGPDVFVALGVRRRSRKSWVSWQEGKVPDVVIELLSERTTKRDRTAKKGLYQDEIRVPEYFWFDPFGSEWQGFRLDCGVYQPIPADSRGCRLSERLGLLLGPWEGKYEADTSRWLRWMTPDGVLLPTAEEALLREQQRFGEERQRVERLAEKLRALGIDPES